MTKQRTHVDGGRPADALAAFVASLSASQIPDAGLRLAERCVVDTVGVTVAGAVDETGAGVAQAMGPAIEGSEPAGTARLLGQDGRTDPATAAFVNGTAGHALDYDDVCDAMEGHPSVTLVPAALAVGEYVEASGQDLLAAFVAGFETLCYLGAPILPDHYEIGWHATSTLGSFGAAATAAHLLDLVTEQTRHALNIAASTPAGLKRNFGTETKPMHAGQAARSGVTAALLAAEGFTADEAAIDGERGFFDRYAESPPASGAFYQLGDRWAVVEDGVGIKKFPCCYFTHSSIEAAARLAADHDLDTDDIESVAVRASQGAADALHHADPSTGLEAKFSMEYTVACGIVRDRVSLAAFADDAVADPDVQTVRERVDFAVNADLPYGSHETTVRIDTTAGETHTTSLDGPPGTHDDPLPDADLRTKFIDCATRAIDRETAIEIHGRLDSLRGCEHVDAALEGL